jgi:hypothetical protein
MIRSTLFPQNNIKKISFDRQLMNQAMIYFFYSMPFSGHLCYHYNNHIFFVIQTLTNNPSSTSLDQVYARHHKWMTMMNLSEDILWLIIGQNDCRNLCQLFGVHL